jgi:hypothetical protein
VKNLEDGPELVNMRREWGGRYGGFVDVLAGGDSYTFDSRTAPLDCDATFGRRRPTRSY